MTKALVLALLAGAAFAQTRAGDSAIAAITATLHGRAIVISCSVGAPEIVHHDGKTVTIECTEPER